VSHRLGSTSPKPGEAGQDGLSLIEVDVADLLAVPAVPAQRRPLEPGGLRLEQDQEELHRVSEADVCEVSCGGERDRGVAAVERSAEAGVG
jgi:hypothetical protein